MRRRRTHSRLVMRSKQEAERGGGAGRETVLLIFQPTHFIVYLL